MLIHFLSSRTLKGYYVTYPIRAFARQLGDIGLKVKIHFREGPSLSDCDVLCLSSDHFSAFDARGRMQFLERYRLSAPVLVWFDTSDSTGTPYFKAMPFVDLYAKSFVYQDRTLYTKDYYGLRRHTHFYHTNNGVRDDREPKRRPARPDELSKIALSWNTGLGNEDINHRKLLRLGLRFGMLSPWASYQPKPAPPGRARPIQLSYRSGGNYSLATVAYQREETRRRLEDMSRTSRHRIICSGPIPHSMYTQELRNTLLAPSPFGWGETSYRDYDVFMAGAALSKPDMGHMENWPDYYEPNVTYVPFAWDFSDFQEVMEGLMESPSRCRDIAQAGQDRYVRSLSDEGGKAFAVHFAALMRQAVQRASAPTSSPSNE